MHPNVVGLVNGFDDLAIVLFVGHEIQTVGVQHQNAHLVLLLLDEIEIALLDTLQILVGDLLLVSPATLPDVALEMIDIQIQIDHQLGLGHAREDDVEKTGKELIFVLLQVVTRKNE